MRTIKRKNGQENILGGSRENDIASTRIYSGDLDDYSLDLNRFSGLGRTHVYPFIG